MPLGLLAAAPPQFFHASVQKDCRDPSVLDQPGIGFVQNAPPPRATLLRSRRCNSFSNSFRAACSARRKSASPESRKISATRFPLCAVQSAGRDLQSSSPDARPERGPTLLLPAPMKPISMTARGLPAGRGAVSLRRHWAVDSGRRLRTPFSRIRFSLRFGYCFSERFLRWILPLKVRSTTVDETATRPTVPAKARPLSRGN